MTPENGAPRRPDGAPSRLEGVAEVIDQIVSSDVAGRGVGPTLYRAARQVQGEPLAWKAARLLAQARQGDVVLLATGWPHRPHVSPEIGETDGPPGTAVLARTLAEVVGVLPLVVTEASLAPAVSSVIQAAGLRPVEPPALLDARDLQAPLHLAGVAPMPVDADAGRSFAREVLDRYRPAAVVVIEKGGLNAAGRAHTSRGHDTSQALAKADLIVEEAHRRGIPTIGVGDGGNEVGMGLIRETVRREVPYGDRCQCPCGLGIAPEQPVDALVVAAVSNWGAYGIGASLAALLDREWPHDHVLEARVLEAAAQAGLCDGPTGWVGPLVDGMPLEVHQAVVALLGEAAAQGPVGLAVRATEAGIRKGKEEDGVAELRILQSSAMGYGNVSWESIERGLALHPEVIVGQGTSADPGPAYLGSDDLHPYVGRHNRKRDLGLILRAAAEAEMPFIFSGGSPSGCDLHLAGVLEVVNELAREMRRSFRVAVISGELDPGWLKRKLAEGSRTEALARYPGLSPTLTPDDVDACKRVVAQMGPEPIVAALQQGVDGVITGRAVDVALYMAYPLFRGFDRSVTAHMAKTVECGALCAEPPIADNVFTILRDDHFDVFPLTPGRRCTVTSVASHAFYERPDIHRELNPGGYLDVSPARYRQVDERTVRVSGARWVDQPYSIKVEGVEPIGYRTMTLAGVRDPALLEQIDLFLATVRRRTEQKWRDEVGLLDFQVELTVFGKDGVLGPSEPESRITGHEAAILAQVLAPTQELATAVTAFLRGQLLFADYPGRTSTAGNVAIPLSPGDIPLGPAFRWRIWHALELEDPSEPFRTRIIQFPCDPSELAWLTGGPIPEGGRLHG